MATTHSYHHGDLRAALLREASAVLEASGAGAISLRALARALEVSHAAPGHHFANRTALLEALASDGFDRFAEALEAAIDDAAPHARSAAIGRAYVRFALDNPERYRLMFTSRLLQGDCPEPLTRASSRAYHALLRAVRPEASEADPASYRMGVPELRAWSLVHGAVMLRLDGQLDDLPDTAFLALVDDMVADGG